MIVSYEHRFIFLKTRKTAGTSIEVLLSQLAGEDAIVTPVTPPAAEHHPRNYTPTARSALSVFRGDPPGAMRRDLRRRRWYFDHMAARLVRARLGAKRWNSFYKFCFERNPWEKTVSSYFFRHGHEPSPPTFRDYVFHGRLPRDFNIYSLDGKSVGVDFVGRFENLTQDLTAVLRDLGITEPVELTREKSGLRPSGATAAKLFDDDTSGRIETAFAREIATFGFKRPVDAGDPG